MRRSSQEILEGALWLYTVFSSAHDIYYDGQIWVVRRPHISLSTPGREMPFAAFSDAVMSRNAEEVLDLFTGDARRNGTILSEDAVRFPCELINNPERCRKWLAGARQIVEHHPDITHVDYINALPATNLRWRVYSDRGIMSTVHDARTPLDQASYSVCTDQRNLYIFPRWFLAGLPDKLESAKSEQVKHPKPDPIPVPLTYTHGPQRVSLAVRRKSHHLWAVRRLTAHNKMETIQDYRHSLQASKVRDV